MEEQLYIHNFGGLKDVTIPLNERFTLFIGPQASGKSIIAKLFYFFKGIFVLSNIFKEHEIPDIDNYKEKVKQRFIKIFPSEFWPEDYFTIEYKIQDWIYVISGNGENIDIEFPKLIIDAINVYNKTYIALNIQKEQNINDSSAAIYSFNDPIKLKSQKVYDEFLAKEGIETAMQFFIVAGRSFFAEVIDNIFPIMRDGYILDPVMTDFGVAYYNAKKLNLKVGDKDKKFEKLLGQVLKGKFIKDGDKEYLLHDDNRKVEIAYASSGQQEALPLAVMMRFLKDFRNGESASRKTIYIEEPEAHLFPLSQKAMIELIAYVANSTKYKTQVVLTTHSPYVMTSFNNLIQASDALNEGADAAKVESIVTKDEIIYYKDVSAYSLSNGKCVNLMDEEMQLISPTTLDEVSEQIADEFGKLVDL